MDSSQEESNGTGTSIFRVVFGVTETLAILVGLPLTIVSLMALQSGVIPNVWVQLVIARVLALFVPLIIADRVLPEGGLGEAGPRVCQ